MNKDQMKGKLDNLKGRVKEALGAASGDKSTQAEGFGERVKGAVQKKVGDIKEAISRHDHPNEDDLEATRRREEKEDMEEGEDPDELRR
jgi:uncharacterized protein YjbJ (UPF0337 family)